MSRNLGDPSRSLRKQSTQAERTIHKQTDAMAGVGLADSTRSIGKLCTWGSGRTERTVLGSPVRKNCTPGSDWGWQYKG
ncbi:hypothetical protein [Lutispora saccharofermentans]|uniref:Uncharacterized protein n=1 Tax=Lutispora saccharofermentans TaxID=3024236 RepID=A0ABT1NBN5_9FIRM|nr:hypothetical protein [Lutispora saccharofermentans]MCQ1528650.1 hypothetical protein [Lutispora saccharofermentans]